MGPNEMAGRIIGLEEAVAILIQRLADLERWQKAEQAKTAPGIRLT